MPRICILGTKVIPKTYQQRMTKDFLFYVFFNAFSHTMDWLSSSPPVFVKNALPFIGFGFLDNLIMILAVWDFYWFSTKREKSSVENVFDFPFLSTFHINQGDYIDLTIGTALGISTMAAAALGNTISDVAGIASAWYVEAMASKIGIKDPDLTPTQMASGRVKWACNLGRAIGVAMGCLLGMFPLLFFPSVEEKEALKAKLSGESDVSESVLVDKKQ